MKLPPLRDRMRSFPISLGPPDIPTWIVRLDVLVYVHLWLFMVSSHIPQYLSSDNFTLRWIYLPWKYSLFARARRGQQSFYSILSSFPSLSFMKLLDPELLRSKKNMKRNISPTNPSYQSTEIWISRLWLLRNAYCIEYDLPLDQSQPPQRCHGRTHW